MTFWLRKLTIQDEKSVIQLLKNPFIQQYDLYIQQCDKNSAFWSYYQSDTSFAIVFNDELIGIVDWIEEDSQCEIGFYLHPSFWGKSIMSQVLDIILSYLDIKYKKIYAYVLKDNKRCKYLLEKKGFVGKDYNQRRKYEYIKNKI